MRQTSSAGTIHMRHGDGDGRGRLYDDEGGAKQTTRAALISGTSPLHMFDPWDQTSTLFLFGNEGSCFGQFNGALCSFNA